MNNEFSEIRALELSTQSLVDFLSRKGAFFSDELIKDHKNIELKEVYFLDEKGQILKLEEDKLLETKVSNILYGEKIKIRVTGNQIQVHTPVKVKLIAESQNKNQKFEGNEKMEWTVKFDNNMADTPYFQIPLNWFDESIEEYNYRKNPAQPLESEPKAYKTTFKKDALPKFKIEVSYDTTQKLQNKAEHTLIPTSYRRNYEELLGLFKKDAKNKEKTNNPKENYEGYFIGLNKNLETITNEFIKYIESFTINTYKDKPYTESQERKLKMKQLNDRIIKDSALLWQKSTEAFRNFLSSKSYDDRPLYWARLKMQSQLKRMPIFKEDIDFETSQVKKGTKLDELIIIFEEKSRNYKGIDFGFTTGKKILITGYDPFILNQFNNDKIMPYSPNVLQSNPSGCLAQYLSVNKLENAKVQTMIFPVRYVDFDQSNNSEKGQGEGVVEKYIKPWISKVDMIITVSQYGIGVNFIDMFSTNRRGGFNDNMNFLRQQKSKAIETDKEWIPTTLKDKFYLYENITLNWIFNDDEHLENTFPKNDEILYSGSGGDYLSNEIFYRIAKMREEIKDKNGNVGKLPTGHLHIEKLQSVNELDRQNYGVKLNFDQTLTSKLLEKLKYAINKTVKNI